MTKKIVIAIAMPFPNKRIIPIIDNINIQMKSTEQHKILLPEYASIIFSFNKLFSIFS